MSSSCFVCLPKRHNAFLTEIDISQFSVRQTPLNPVSSLNSLSMQSTKSSLNSKNLWAECTYYLQNPYPYLNVRYYQLSNKQNIIFITNLSNTSPKKLTIIYSPPHEKRFNNFAGMLFDICTQLKCDIVAYEYTQCSQENFMRGNFAYDLESLLHFMKNYKNIPYENIILFGDVYGSIPSLQVVSKKRYHDIKGLVVMNPLSEIVIKMNKQTTKLNLVKGLEQIETNCFVIYGRSPRNIVKEKQSVDISLNLKNVYNWNPKNGTHKNIVTRWRYGFYNNMRYFFEHFLYHNTHSKIQPKKPPFDEFLYACSENSTINFSFNKSDDGYNENEDKEGIKFMNHNQILDGLKSIDDYDSIENRINI